MMFWAMSVIFLKFHPNVCTHHGRCPSSSQQQGGAGRQDHVMWDVSGTTGQNTNTIKVVSRSTWRLLEDNACVLPFEIVSRPNK
jgi:hypothetical protein